MSDEQFSDQASVDDRFIGAVVAGRYRVEQLLGAGAMGRVYRARHTKLPRCFALRILTGELATEPRMRMRFAQEAEVGSAVDHPNLVSALDFGSDDGVLYLAMDYVEGETLAEVIAREAPIAPTRVIALARQLASGLAHAHERGLLHHDLRPESILFDTRPGDTPVVRILDLGLALDGPIDTRVDLFALGVVLHEMLAGASEIVRRKPTEPPGLEDIIARLLERDPADRFATARDLVAALAAVELPAEAQVAVPPERGGWQVATFLAIAMRGVAGALWR
jgi:serine/threonine protein kinase